MGMHVYFETAALTILIGIIENNIFSNILLNFQITYFEKVNFYFNINNG